HPHHHHPHHHHHHAGVAIGPLPNPCIGMVAAPTAAGPVLAGIGVPIMTAAAPLVGPPPPIPPPPHNHNHQHQQQQQHSHKKLVMSPDSSDDKDKCGGHPFIQARTSPSGIASSSVSCASAMGAGSQLTWSSAPGPTGPIIQAGIAYPVMSIPPGALTEPNGAATAGMIYGVPMSAGPGITDHQVSAAAAGVNVNSVMIPTSNGIVTGSTMGMVQQAPSISISPVIPNPNQNNCTGSTTISPSQQQHQQQQQTQQNPQQPTKEIIHCKSCTLFPPNPNAPPPTTRDKPPGCRTVFVGGLPENVTEDIVREIFDRCGEITTIRMSKKNFCHIRFEMEQFVELALYLSGYRIRIGSNSDSANIGRLHVDYAQARDDLYEWECRQRQLLREQRHRERLEQERLQPPSPPPTVHYSDHEATNVAERIKGDDTFMKAIQTLFTWLEKGECLKRNSNTFYSMIQSTNSQIRRLLNEKSQYEDEFQRAKDLMRQRMTGMLMQFTQIEKIFSAACQRKVWDHFSKAQRKNIEVWRKQAAEIKNVLLEEALNERADEEMEFSDLESESGQSNKENGEPRAKKMRLTVEENAKTVHQLKVFSFLQLDFTHFSPFSLYQEENDALRCQLEASKNEVDLIKADLRSELEMKDQQLRSLQQQVLDVQSGISSPSQVVTTCPSFSDSMSPGTTTTKQNLHSPVSVSSSSPAFGLSPTHNNNGNSHPIGNGSSSSSISINGSNGAELMASSLNGCNKEIQGYCDSSSSTNSLLHLQKTQSAQNNQHNHNNNSNKHTGSNNSSNSSGGAGDDSHEILIGAVVAENAGGGGSSISNNHNKSNSNSSSDQIIGISEKEARLVGIISTFLHVHPFGASVDYIWSYAQKVLPMVRPNQIELLMTKFPSLFRQEVSGIGATFERKWVFVGFS
ncbi:Ecto-NOX disulfide-thiol exchanger 1, partial [Orchesella cincta]